MLSYILSQMMQTCDIVHQETLNEKKKLAIRNIQDLIDRDDVLLDRCAEVIEQSNRGHSYRVCDGSMHDYQKMYTEYLMQYTPDIKSKSDSDIA